MEVIPSCSLTDSAWEGGEQGPTLGWWITSTGVTPQLPTVEGAVFTRAQQRGD